MNSRSALLLLLTLTILLAVVGRFYARKMASGFGDELSTSLTSLNAHEFANTKAYRDFLDGPKMSRYSEQIGMLSILGGGYDTRSREVRSGLIYLSEQMALPQNNRFSKVPTMRHFKIEPDSTTDRSVTDAASKLIHEYRKQIVDS